MRGVIYLIDADADMSRLQQARREEAFSYISARGCFQDLNRDLLVTRQQLYRCAKAPLHISRYSILQKLLYIKNSTNVNQAFKKY